MEDREGLLGYRLNFEQNGIYIGAEEWQAFIPCYTEVQYLHNIYTVHEI